MVEAYYRAIEADDADAIAAAFSPEASLSVDSFVIQQVHNGAGAGVFDRVCEPDAGEPGAFVVICEGEYRTYLHQVVDAPATAATVTYTVTAQGFENVGVSFDSPAFPANAAFGVWMSENHPENSAAATGTTAPESIDEARSFRELTLQYADLWAAYLTETGCTYDDIGC